jgi:hypothetical protein
VVFALFIVILSIGFSLWIGELLGKTYYGFFTIGGFYVVLAILMHYFRHPWLKLPISNSVIKQLLKQKSA